MRVERRYAGFDLCEILREEVCGVEFGDAVDGVAEELFGGGPGGVGCW